MKKILLIIISVLVLGGEIIYAATISDSVLEKFTEQEKQYQLPVGILAKIAKIESNGDTNAHPPCSGCSALGLFQWTQDSWLSATKSLYGSAKELDLRRNPFIATEVTAFATGQTKSQIGQTITSAGVDMSVGLYMGHFLGIGGAKKFFGLMIQDKNATAAPYFPKAAGSNKEIFYGGQSGTRTFAEIVNFFATKMNQPGVTAVSGYNGTLSAKSESGRIMDTSGDTGLSQVYSGSVPTSDPEFDYQSDYTSRQPNGQPTSPYYNSSSNNTNPTSNTKYNPGTVPYISTIPTTQSILSIPVATSTSINNIFDTSTNLFFPQSTTSTSSNSTFQTLLSINFGVASISSSSISYTKGVDTSALTQNIARITSTYTEQSVTNTSAYPPMQDTVINNNTFIETASQNNTNTDINRSKKLSILESIKQILLAMQVILSRIKNPFSH